MSGLPHFPPAERGEIPQGAMARTREQDIPTIPTAGDDLLVDPGPPVLTDVAAFSTPSTPGGPALQPGVIVAERFLLHERVAMGGTVDVYRARDLLTDHYDRHQSMVALKVLSENLRTNRQLSAAVLGAAAQVRRLRHPNIEQVLELHRFGDDYAIVTEWLDGESLAAHFDQHGPMSPRELAPLLADVGAAIEYAHRNGIVHGDIKPGNVFLCTDGRARLVDFGYCHGATSLYASCEVLQNLPPTPQDDVYSLACLIYRVTTGAWPFGEHTSLQAEAESALPSRPGALSRRQWVALRRGLAFRREERLRTPQELIAPFTTRRARLRTSLPILVLLFAVTAGWVAWQPGVETEDAMEIDKAAEPPTTLPVAGPMPGPVEPASSAAPTPEVPPPSAVVATPAPAPATRRHTEAAALPTIGFSKSRVVATTSAGFVKLRVRASGQLRGPVQLSVSAVEGAARLNEDFISPANRLILRPDTPYGDVLVSILDGAPRENAEDFRVELGIEEGDARLGRASTVVVLK